ncbi:MAG TPA: glycosyltransferase family 4 protein [Saprospiraceae bacterium]|nr:glycosyltransferase family 4 protein [Saprospiraceae bacterium]
MYRVLLITYYWPPAGGGGVQRWLKFSKYLREFDIEPIIYTPSNPEYPAFDESLLEEVPSDLEVWRHPIWEPYKYYRRFTGQPADKKIYSGFITENTHETLTQKISVFIRGNLFIPDARKFWIKPSVKYLIQKLSQSPVDLIVSTGPPHSMHMIAYGVVKQTHLPWIADFRDPWTGIDFYDKLRLTKWADRVHHQKERRVLQAADAVVTVSPYCVKHLEELSGRHVHLITNGYDENDFTGEFRLTKEFSITYIGSINPDRNPSALWDALEALLTSNIQLRNDLWLNIVGPIDRSVQVMLDSYPLLRSHIHIVEWLDHQEAMELIRSSQVLLLLLNDTPHTRGLLPGKLFEYLGAGRPILCIGAEDGDAAQLIRASAAGITIDLYQGEKMRESISSLYNSYLQGNLKTATTDSAIRMYARRNIVRTYAALMKEVLVKSNALLK